MAAEYGNTLVYFVATQDLRYLKIGYTEDWYNRKYEVAKQAQKMFSQRVRVIGFFPGNYGTERWIQALFARHQYSKEWYVFHEDIAQYLASLCLLSPSFSPSHGFSGAIRRKKTDAQWHLNMTPEKRQDLEQIRKRREAVDPIDEF